MQQTGTHFDALSVAQTVLGYLNFSNGAPSAKFQKALDTLCTELLGSGELHFWRVIPNWLEQQAAKLREGGAVAFQDVDQAMSVARLAFGPVLSAYRQHHRDLLAHQTDTALFTPFFLARVCEAILQEGAPWEESQRLIPAVLRRLNDYVGHRPIAILETRPQTDYYPHEKLRPVPLFFREVGACLSPYQEIVSGAIQILQEVPEDIAREALFDLSLLDELAFDPRAYDHSHPANRRPNYLFGEWDPHVIDGHGHYRRFVVRQTVLKALLDRVENPTEKHLKLRHPRQAILFEASAVLAGTILMASGVSGNGPTAFDSDSRLSGLVPIVAKFRDRFYQELLNRTTGDHGQLLQEEAVRLKQPFGGIRQHLNHELARQRASQLQNHELAIVLASLGLAEESRAYASRISTTSARILSEVAIRQTSADFLCGRGELEKALPLLEESEDLIHRGIECGALADPWNILGYQGLYPLFQSKEDSTHDPRNDELIDTLTRQFDLYAKLLAAAASTGQKELRHQLAERVTQLANWWDQFATYEVSDVPRLHGGERAEAALHVARSLAEWNKRDRSQSSAKEDIAFWQSKLEGFTSAAAFSQVIEALLEQQDWRAAMALLITWLSESPKIPLEDGAVSFHDLATKWLEGTLVDPQAGQLIPRFFELLPTNADEYWSVPTIDSYSLSQKPKPSEGWLKDSLVYKDSTDDGNEGGVLNPDPEPFPLEEASKELELRLGFLYAVADLWRRAACVLGDSPSLETWIQTARAWGKSLNELVEQLHAIEIPTPITGVDEVLEYDRQRMIKDHLTDVAIDTCVELNQALRALSAVQNQTSEGATGWEEFAGQVERAIAQGDAQQVRAALPALVRRLSREPLLFVPLSEGGDPTPILHSRTTLALFEHLLEKLPTLGLIRETYHLIRLAKSMERNGPESGRRVSEFDRLFRIALRSVVDTLLDAAKQWEQDKATTPDPLVTVLRKVADSFLNLWVQHSQTLRLSSIEAVQDESDWEPFKAFIQRYGREIFTATFLTYGNIRGVLHRGVGEWLDRIREQHDGPRPEKLLDHIERGKISRSSVIHYLEITLHTIAEHYEEYRDYNTTTTWSDYGENLYVLLDFLRVKAAYERYAWRLRPMVLAHDALCRKGLTDVVERWEKNISEFSQSVAQDLLNQLAQKEALHAVRLRTIRDRLEERFLRPLALDRLCAAVEPTAIESRQGQLGPAFEKLSQQLRELADHPIGVGLDVPQWLKRLQEEADKAREKAISPPKPAPAPRLTFSELQKQFAEWDEPLTGTI